MTFNYLGAIITSDRNYQEESRQKATEGARIADYACYGGSHKRLVYLQFALYWHIFVSPGYISQITDISGIFGH